MISNSASAAGGKTWPSPRRPNSRGVKRDARTDGVLSKQVEIVAASKEAVALRRGDRRENQYSRFASADGVVACVKAGLGIAVVSQWMCRAELERGELERILPEYELDPVEVHAVYPAGPYPSPKVRAFSDY